MVARLVETVVSAVESILPPPDTYGTAIKLDGDAAFRRATIEALDKIKSTPTGKALLEAIEKSGKTITIKETAGGNEVTGLGAGAMRNADGTKGAGSDSTVGFNPNRESIGTEPWETRPPAVGLAHELVHAQHAATGDIKTDQVENDSKPDPANPGGHATEMDEEVRTVGIPPYDGEPYSENKIRSEWDPPQTERKWY
jgi:type VI secretion system secreted protein VgrG